MRMPLFLLALAAMVSLLHGARADANDFPTQARVEFVLSCMDERGGQSYDTLYPCICIIDRIASRITYRDYTAAETLSFLFSTPGERGGIFRDAAPQSRKRIKALRALREDAEAGCLIPGVASSSTQ
ncbi:MAG: hypothetical protein OXC08_01440 [Thiotrichales bacterium]|nr:hypothetical protein [Thiotrichales bacterium]